ncbi:HYR domain-containing protein [Microbacterium aureliae]
MGLFRMPKTAIALAAAAALVMGGATAAVADNITLAGDGVAFSDNDVTIQACTDRAVSFSVLIRATRNGNPSDTQTNNNVFRNGETVTFTHVAQEGMTVAYSDASILLEPDWQSQQPGQYTSADSARATVTLPSKSASGSGTVKFSASGQNNAGGAVTPDRTLTVRWGTPTACTTPPPPVDRTAPVVTVPGAVVEEATGASGAVVTYVATATDETAPASPAVTCDPASGSVFSLGTTTVACSATDAAGNTGSADFTVTVQDTTPPAVGPMTDIGFEASGPQTVVTWTDPTATDAVWGSPAVTCSPASGSAFDIGQTTVTCSATDGAGLTGSSTFTVTISDTSAPNLVVPANMEEEATGPDGASVVFEATAFDAVDGDRPVTCNPASGATFALGSTTVTCAAQDSRGNSTTDSFDVTVVDTTGPEITVPSPITAEATGPTGTAVPFTATASDLVDGDVSVRCTPAAGSVFPLGPTPVSCVAVDNAGNENEAEFVVTVEDTTPPAVTVPASMTREATSPSGATVSFEATATDVVDGPLTPTCVPAAGSTFPLGPTTVQCSVTDSSTNIGTGSFTVTVVDTTGPSIQWVGGPAQGASYPVGQVPAQGTCTATDLVDGSRPCSITGYDSGVGSQTMTAVASDTRGNTTQVERTYTVRWRLPGFHRPIDPTGTLNLVKAGSTVPLKFEVFASSDDSLELSAVSAIGASFTAIGIKCSADAPKSDDTQFLTTGKTELRYDPNNGGQFIQNWATPKDRAGSCFRVTLTVADGGSISADFQLTK